MSESAIGLVDRVRRLHDYTGWTMRIDEGL